MLVLGVYGYGLNKSVHMPLTLRQFSVHIFIFNFFRSKCFYVWLIECIVRDFSNEIQYYHVHRIEPVTTTFSIQKHYVALCYC